MNAPDKVKTILLTGSTGFVGSNLAAYFINKGVKVIALNRSASDRWRLKAMLDNPLLVSVNWEDADLKEKIAASKPETTIHAAWGGVKVSGRDDWDVQMENINLTFSVLSLSKHAGVKQFIGCGTWFEYGLCNGRINEAHEAGPNSAYSSAKVIAYHMVKHFCHQYHISWLWLRLFSIIGKHEDEQWVTTYAIKNIIAGNPINLTPCEQQMDYSDITFICHAIFKATERRGVSGLFNLGSNTSIPLKKMIEMVGERLREYNPEINFGALPYRANQVMHIEGDSSAFYDAFGITENPLLELAIDDIIRSYRV